MAVRTVECRAYNTTKTESLWRSWLRHCATSRKVAGSIPDGAN